MIKYILIYLLAMALILIFFEKGLASKIIMRLLTILLIGIIIYYLFRTRFG